MASIYTQEQAINLLKEKYGERYDYSDVIYKNVTEKFKVTCKEHGEFFIAFWEHYNNGRICKKCSYIERSSKRTIPVADFINVASRVHNFFYDYSKVVYINNDTKVEIVCPLHGEFYQKPEKHKKGQNCPRCAGNVPISKSEFLVNLSDKNKGIYDYSLVTDEHFKSKDKLLPITCPTHGVFRQSYRTHLRGSGCPNCAKNGFKRGVAGTLYVIKSGNITKIGITNNSVKSRINQIENSFGKKFEIIGEYPDSGEKCLYVEKYILTKIRSRYKQVSDKFDGFTECFYDVDLDWVLKEIKEAFKRFNDV